MNRHERERRRIQEEIDGAKSEFVSIISHDLRSPLSTLTGYADLMVTRWDGLTDEQKQNFLAIISRTAKSLAQLIDDITQVERIESGAFQYDVAPFDLGELVRRVATETGGAKARVEVEVEVEKGLPLALGDSERQWQILTNLVSNAIKSSDEDGHVDIEVAREMKMLQVKIHDHGAGVSPEELPKLFQKFSRIKQVSGKKVTGTGLGLFMAKSMVEAQGGEIWATSVPGEGSALYYTVPTTT